MKSQFDSTMTSKSLPRTLPAWIQALDAVVLPAFADVHAQVLRSLNDSSLSMRQIADIIQESPVLALNVIRDANRNADSPAESLEVALGRIGLKRAETLLMKIPPVARQDISPHLRQTVLISRHATQLANGLFASRLARLWQEIHWSSLLFLSPIWTIVTAYPHLLDVWEQRVLVRREPIARIEQEFLGVSLPLLCATLARHWGLPEWIEQGYRLFSANRRMLVKALHIARDSQNPLHQQQKLDADPSLRRWLTQPSNTILLANGLALAAHHSWSDTHSLRWQRFTGLYLQLPLDQVQQMIHQQSVASARAIGPVGLAGLWHPAQALLWPWDSRFQQPRKAQLPSAERLAEWRQHCRELLSETTPYENVVQLSATACKALACTGLQRVLLMLADHRQQRLIAQQACGLPAASLRLSLDAGQNQILRKLLEKPAQLNLSPSNYAKFAALLPDALKALFPSEHLLLRSLGHGEHVSMLIVADQDDCEFTDTGLQAFSKTVQCIERAMLVFSKRRR